MEFLQQASGGFSIQNKNNLVKVAVSNISCCTLVFFKTNCLYSPFNG